MPNFDASVGLASTFILPTRTFPFDSTPNWSIIGATAPQLGHHGAQAHINTGNGDFNTMLSKLPSLIIIGCGVNNSSVFNCVPHLPQKPRSIIAEERYTCRNPIGRSAFRTSNYVCTVVIHIYIPELN